MHDDPAAARSGELRFASPPGGHRGAGAIVGRESSIDGRYRVLTGAAAASKTGSDVDQADVRFGSKADICSAQAYVRFTPNSGHVRCTRGCPLWANSGHRIDYDCSGNGARAARQNHPDLREFAGLGIHLDRAAVLLDDDIVADGKAKTGALSGWFRREEWVEHL